MKTTVDLKRDQIEKIVQDHLQSKLSLYGSTAVKTTSTWSSDGTMSMQVVFEEQTDEG